MLHWEEFLILVVQQIQEFLKYDLLGTDIGAISTDGQTLTVGDIMLDYPGDSKVITATIENLGTIDATVNSFNISKTGAIADQDVILVDILPSTNFALTSGTTQQVTLTVTWLSSATTTLTGAVGFIATANYSQIL